MAKKNNLTVVFIVLILLLFSCNSNNDKTIDKLNNNKTHINYHKDSTTNSITPPKPIIKSKTALCLEGMGLIDIKDSLPELIIDLKYSTSDNFIGIDFYGDLTEAYIQHDCYVKLKAAYNILKDTMPEYTFIIYDAVRSTESQQLMWDSVDVPENRKHWYVARPDRGSIHNYGMALDITIADQNGMALDMGSHFDCFDEISFPNKSEDYLNSGALSKEQYSNRMLLFEIMKKADFYVAKTEWWHYNATSLKLAKEKYPIFSLTNCK